MADLVEQLLAAVPAIKAETYSSPRGDVSLLPRFRSDNAGLVTLWKGSSGQPSVSLWRTVFERRAHAFIEPIEELTNQPMGQGRVIEKVTPELLTLIGQAYRAAKVGRPHRSASPRQERATCDGWPPSGLSVRMITSAVDLVGDLVGGLGLDERVTFSSISARNPPVLPSRGSVNLLQIGIVQHPRRSAPRRRWSGWSGPSAGSAVSTLLVFFVPDTRSLAEGDGCCRRSGRAGPAGWTRRRSLQRRWLRRRRAWG